MKQEIWQDQQKVLVQDMNWAQSTKEEAIRERLADMVDTGVLKNSQLGSEPYEFQVIDASSGGIPKITVKTGVAFTPIGERILIDTIYTYDASAPSLTTNDGIGGFTPTPQSTGSQSIPLTPSSTNYIWIGYLNTIDPLTYTLAKTPALLRLFMKGGDGFKFGLTLSSNHPDFPATNTIWVSIATVTTDATSVTGITVSGASRTLSSLKRNRVGITVPAGVGSRPSTYASGESKQLDDHVNSIGDGTASPTNPHATAFVNMSGQTTEAQLGTDCVTETKIKNGEVKEAKLADDAVASAKIKDADGTTAQDTSLGYGVKTGHLQNGAVTYDKLDSSLQNTLARSSPIGTVVAFAGSTEPAGWVECDGRALPTSGTGGTGWGTYPTDPLYAAIGTSWGTPGAGQFNVPDLRGVFLRGRNQGAIDAYRDADGRSNRLAGGVTTGVGSFQQDAIGTHHHSETDLTFGGSIASGGTFVKTTGNTTGTVTDTTGGGGVSTYENRSKNACVMYIIKVL